MTLCVRVAPERRSTPGLSADTKLSGFAVSLVVCLLIGAIGARGQALPDDWPQTATRLTQLLAGTSEQKRAALAEIRGLRSEAASRLAVPLLSDDDEVVRATAAAAVVFLPAPDAAASLRPLLSDKKPFVRREAAYALGTTRDPDAVGPLVSVMSNDRDREVRSAAAIALGTIGNPQALDDLTKVLRKKPDEDDEFLRRSAARSIGQIFEVLHGGGTYTITPQNFLPPQFKDVAPAAANAPAPASSRAVVETLSLVLQDPREAPDTRREAAFALGAARQPGSAVILRTFLNSPDPYLAEIIKEALLKIDGQE